MAIWSLTQERVEKLLKQIGEKQHEIDTLIKLSPKDIWKVDLDAFMEEWDVQLQEEVKRKKKIAAVTRRPSQKLGIGAGKGKGKKKRKADGSDSDDSGSDFGPVKKKAKPKKEGLLSYLQQEPAKKPTAAEALKSSSAFGSSAPQKQGTLLAHLVKKKEETPQTEGGEDGRSASADSVPAPAPAKRGRPAAAKAIKKDPISDDEDSDVFAVVAQEAAKEPSKTAVSRTARSAKKAAPKYNLGSDSDDDDDDDLLGDVSTMVKTIGSGTSGVPMFKATTTARPAPVTKKNSIIEIDGDTTNYEGLMPQSSPQRPPPRNIHDTIMSSDEDDFDLGAKKPVASRLNAKPAAKPKVAAAKPAPKPKTVTKKPTAQSPAAKAYAKKHGKDAEAAKPAAKTKKQTTIDSDEDEEMEDADAIANDILSDEDEDEPTPKPAARAPAARPGRRAAAKPAKYVVSDDEAESDEASEPSFDDDDDSE